MPLFISSFYTKANTASLGGVVLRHITDDDAALIKDWVRSVANDRDFTVQLLHRQLKEPQIDLEGFKALPDAEIAVLMKAYAEKELHTTLDSNDANMFLRFRDAVEGEFKRQQEQTEKTIRDISTALRSPYIEAAEKFRPFAGSGILDSINMFASAIQGSDLLRQTTSVLDAITEARDSATSKFTEAVSRAIKSPLFDLNYITNQFSAFSNWADANSGIFKNINDYLASFKDVYRINEKQAAKSLKKYNWFVTPSLPAHILFEAVKLSRKRGNQRRAINQLYWNYFSENNFQNLEAMVEDWAFNPLFKRRMKILRDCVKVLKNAKKRDNPTNVLLPVLIAQIEGISISYRKKKGFIAKSKKYFLAEWRTWFEADTAAQDVLSQHYLELTNYIFFEVLFQTAIPGQPLGNPFTFSRHKIQHGEYLNYGRKDNLIRAFLVLDFLAALN